MFREMATSHRPYPTHDWTATAGWSRLAAPLKTSSQLLTVECLRDFYELVVQRPIGNEAPADWESEAGYLGKWWARSDSNRGPRDSLLPRRFRREWTISSPQWGAGRSSLSLSATRTRSGSLCTFRRCTAGLAQGCHRHCSVKVPLNSSRPLHTLRCEGTIVDESPALTN